MICIEFYSDTLEKVKQELIQKGSPDPSLYDIVSLAAELYNDISSDSYICCKIKRDPGFVTACFIPI
jgi:hypothetical protein